MRQNKWIQVEDVGTFIRGFVIAALLVIDALFGRFRSIPPVSIINASVIAIFLAFWLIWKIRTQQGLPKTPFTLPFTLYITAISISTIFSSDQRGSLDELISSIVIILIFFVICDLVSQIWSPESIEWAIILFVSFLLIQGMVEIGKWFWTWFSISVPEYPALILEYRLFGVSSWPNILGMLIYVSIPFIIFRLADTNHSMNKVFWFIWLIIAEIVFFFADSRGALIASMIVIFGISLWIIYRKGIPLTKNYRQWILSNKMLLASLAFFITFYFVLHLVFRNSNSHSGFVRHGGGFSGGRFYFWEIALDIFTRYPIFGSGLGTYPQFYLEANPSGVIGWISPHPHNIIFETISTIGLLGLISLAMILSTFLIIIIRNFLPITRLSSYKTNKYQSYIIGGGCALIAFIAHSMVDRLTAIPHSIIPVLMILVLFLYALGEIKLREKRVFRKAYLYLAILFIIYASMIPINLAQSAQINGLLNLYNHEWINAVDQLTRARDLDRNFVLYSEQLAYAQGALALSSDSKINIEILDQSISNYEYTLDQFSYWAPNYANLSVLQKHSGNPENAITTLEEIPREWMGVWNFPQLILANYFESSGDLENASNLYRKALEQNIWSKDDLLCVQSELCRNITELDNVDQDYLLHFRVIELLESGDENEAMQLLNLISINESSSIIWIDRAITHFQLGEIDQAKFTLKIAEKLNVQNHPQFSTYYAWIKSKILLSEERSIEAIKILESSERPLLGTRYYETMLFNRLGVGEYLLPKLTSLQKNIYNLENLILLQELYINENKFDDANWAGNQALPLYQLINN